MADDSKPGPRSKDPGLSVTVSFSDGSADLVTGDDPWVHHACALARSFVGSRPAPPHVTLVLDDGRTVPVSNQTMIERRIRRLARRIY